MTNEAKLTMLKTLLDPMSSESIPSDSVLTTYLTAAENEILAWRYSYWESLSGTEAPTTVPAQYEMTQIHAVIAGFGLSGSEGLSNTAENGISKSFRYSDMIDYIRKNVIPYAGML